MSLVVKWSVGRLFGLSSPGLWLWPPWDLLRLRVFRVLGEGMHPPRVNVHRVFAGMTDDMTQQCGNHVEHEPTLLSRIGYSWSHFTLEPWLVEEHTHTLDTPSRLDDLFVELMWPLTRNWHDYLWLSDVTSTFMSDHTFVVQGIDHDWPLDAVCIAGVTEISQEP